MTVNILCTGDTQLGKAFGTLGASAGDFRNQLFATFKRVMNDAKDYDLVLVAGDVFDREGTPTSLIEAAAGVFAACKTPTVVLAGNHDSSNQVFLRCSKRHWHDEMQSTSSFPSA